MHNFMRTYVVKNWIRPVSKIGVWCNLRFGGKCWWDCNNQIGNKKSVQSLLLLKLFKTKKTLIFIFENAEKVCICEKSTRFKNRD